MTGRIVPTADPAFASVLTPGDVGPPPTGPPDVEQVRADNRSYSTRDTAPVELGSVTDGVVAGVPIRTYRPLGPDVPPALVLFAHGGGWVAGDLDGSDAICSRLARASNATVVSIDYRLAPEHPFPAAVDDAEIVLRWAVDGGWDPSRIVLCGVSAGGNIAAGLAMRLRTEPELRAAALALMYPVLDRRRATESYRDFATDHLLTAERMRWYWECYAPGPLAEHPEVSLSTAPDLASMPPTLLEVPECDVLRDESLEFAERLELAGVDVTVRVRAGMIHGFAAMSDLTPVADVALADVAAWIGRTLDP